MIHKTAIIDPKAKIPKPVPKRISPIANFTGPDGLYFDSQIFEKIGAKAIIKKELSIPNQDAGTSGAGSVNCRYNIQITIAQITTNPNPRRIFERAYFEYVCLNNIPRTQVMMIIGITVNSVLNTLNMNL